jgi:hypothetical protein
LLLISCKPHNPYSRYDSRLTMNSRSTTILGLIQLMFCFAIILAARLSLKLSGIGDDAVGLARPLPFFLQFAHSYGFLLMLLPMLWTIFTAIFCSKTQVSTRGLSLSGVSGVAIILFLALMLLLLLSYPLMPIMGPLKAE